MVTSTNLTAPRYWPAWIGFAFVRCLVWLPLRWQYRIAQCFARIIVGSTQRRHRIVLRNLEIAFPEMSATQRHSIARRSIDSFVMTVVETLFVWFRGVQPLLNRVRISGLEHLSSVDQAGVLVLGAHFASLDLCVTALSAHHPLGATYRKFKHPVVEHFARRARQHCYAELYEAVHLKAILAGLCERKTIWFACDQDMGNRKSACFVPFFNVETSTVETPFRLARKAGAKMVFMSHRRNIDDMTWEISLTPVEPANTTEPDYILTDATRVNQLIETAIRSNPAQYFWVHRRFKSTSCGQRRDYGVD